MKIKRLKEHTPEKVDVPGANNTEYYPMITAKDGASGFAMRLFDLKGGGNTPKHQHDWEHEIFIVSGSGKILDKDRYIDISVNDFIFVEKDELHQFIAGEEGLKFICVVPNRGQPA